jgi:biotin transport system substrate-specific component
MVNSMKKTTRSKTQKIVFTALMAAIMCIVAPWSIPLGGVVQITLGTLALYTIGALTEPLEGLCAVAVYIALGAVGLPVFSSFQGGIQKLIGPSGGFLLGYLFCVVIEALLCRALKYKWWAYPISMLIGAAALYICAVIWYMVTTSTALGAAVAGCVIPFIPGDLLKIVFASLIAFFVRPRLKKI